MPWPSATTSNRGRVLVACTCRVTLLVGGATVKQPHPPWSGGSLAIWLQPAQRPREIAGLEVELAYDATEGRTEREYLQVFVRDPGPIPKGGRVVPMDRLQPCFNAILALGPVPRLQRSLFQYDLALRNWQIGTEYQSLDHLWIAAENIVELLLDQRIGNKDPKELALR